MSLGLICYFGAAEIKTEQSAFACFPSSWVSHALAAEGQELISIIIIACFPSVALTSLALAIRKTALDSRTDFLFPDICKSIRTGP